MRQIVSYLIAAITCIVFLSGNPAFGAVVENQNLKEVISQCHDTHMTVEDLAFFLATHNHDAMPKDVCVELKLNGENCKLVPNGKEPGLCSIKDLSIMVG